MELPQLTMEQLSKLVASNSPPSQLFEALTEYEQEACLMTEGSGRSEGTISNPELLSLFYSSFFLVHLLTDQISEAHALTKRMPTKLKHEDPSLQNCLALLRAVWQTEHGQVYRILRELPWSEAVRPLVQRYESFFQDKTLISVSRSYETIRLSVAAFYLGLDQDSAAQEDPNIISNFTKCGWKWDPDTKLLHPKPIVVRPAENQPYNGIREAMAMLGARAS
ncbi:unnamed protein product [Penicillium salamii]|uniref:COP9 signalosome complex subunit 8 n=1 Tax=Penicillium salamii TaxID=1612424 RepID=A0A9W4NHC0_9EURO|nr:unnamed protein product [Penicillium salamii]CAG8369796.1 unnamed protein product [Penicillium salamii]CAG8400511.1 unnamed protein product [Penicillium salamii]